MTELEIMQRAKMYMDKLAQGVDPISGAASDSVLGQARLLKCFGYVSGVLQQVIDNGGKVGAVAQEHYVLSAEQIARLRPMDRPIRIREFTDMVAAASDDPSAKHPSTTVITQWLMDKGFMERMVNADGKSQRIPTDAGQQLGIFTENRTSPRGDYLGVFYSPQAQQFLIDHLGDIFSQHA